MKITLTPLHSEYPAINQEKISFSGLKGIRIIGNEFEKQNVEMVFEKAEGGTSTSLLYDDYFKVKDWSTVGRKYNYVSFRLPKSINKAFEVSFEFELLAHNPQKGSVIMYSGYRGI